MEVFILAGGQSVRMGEDKANLPFKNHTMLAAIFKLAKCFSPQVSIIGHKKYAAHFPNVYQDIVTDGGPLAGIYTALVHSKSNNTFILSCDMPFVQIGLLNRLAMYKKNKIVCFCTAQGLQPFPALFHSSLKDSIARSLLKEERGLKYFIEQEQPKIIAIEQEDLFLNLNTPEQYLQATKKVEK